MSISQRTYPEVFLPAGSSDEEGSDRDEAGSDRDAFSNTCRADFPLLLEEARDQEEHAFRNLVALEQQFKRCAVVQSDLSEPCSVLDDADVLFEWRHFVSDHRSRKAPILCDYDDTDACGPKSRLRRRDQIIVAQRGGTPLVAAQWLVPPTHPGSPKALRALAYQQYTVLECLKKQIEHFDFIWIDQGWSTGGCGFAALAQMCQLCGCINKWESATGMEFSRLRSSRYFTKMYREYNLDFGYRSWFVLAGQVIRVIQAMTGTDASTLFRHFKYEFFRTRGDRINRDMPTNNANHADAESYAIGVVSWIKGQLLAGNVVAVPFAAHFIPIIGFKEDNFLFIGSHGQGSELGGLHELHFSEIEFGDIINDALIGRVGCL